MIISCFFGVWGVVCFDKLNSPSVQSSTCWSLVRQQKDTYFLQMVQPRNYTEVRSLIAWIIVILLFKGSDDQNCIRQLKAAKRSHLLTWHEKCKIDKIYRSWRSSNLYFFEQCCLQRKLVPKPIASMYGIFTYIYHKKCISYPIDTWGSNCKCGR